MKIAAIAVAVAVALMSAACGKEVPSYMEPSDYAGCRQAALDHKDQLGNLLNQVLDECAKNDPDGFEQWQKNR